MWMLQGTEPESVQAHGGKGETVEGVSHVQGSYFGKKGVRVH